MKNSLILGFGRSGTSLMGGILHQAGYYMGDGLYPPRHSNPKGFFECAFINGINERILRYYDYNLLNDTYPDLGKVYSPFCPGEGHRWLTYIATDIQVKSNDRSIPEDILRAVSIPNFAYKDPRFNYTLDVWLPFFKEDVVFLCMFRDPAETVESVITECATAEYLCDFAITHQLAEELWYNSYTRLLQKFNQISSRKFIFIHYEQLLSGSILDKIADFLCIKINDRFVEKTLYRTKTKYQVSVKTREVYERLCSLADFNL
jgi:hypothetical protein